MLASKRKLAVLENTKTIDRLPVFKPEPLLHYIRTLVRTFIPLRHGIIHLTSKIFTF